MSMSNKYGKEEDNRPTKNGKPFTTNATHKPDPDKGQYIFEDLEKEVVVYAFQSFKGSDFSVWTHEQAETGNPTTQFSTAGIFQAKGGKTTQVKMSPEDFQKFKLGFEHE